MMLKIITMAIIASNILILNQDVPNSIILTALCGLLLSLFISHKTLRNITKIILLALAMVFLRLHFKTLLVTECGVSFVLILSALKFWELNEERDHFNMFLILALSECSIFLLNPSFLVFSFGLIKMLFYFYYILKIRQYDINLLNPKRMLILILPSMTLALLLYYTFPRFTQGFINANEMQYIISGGGSQFHFNQLGPINLSSEQAFKVFGLENSKLPLKILYWRTNVLWQFSNQEWSSSNGNLKLLTPREVSGPLHYNVEVMQNMKEHLPVLDGASSISWASQPFVGYSDGSFRLRTISRGNLTYQANSNYFERQQEASPLMIKKGLRLKSERAAEIKQVLLGEIQERLSDEEKIKLLMRIFKDRNYQYSTTPPTYNSVEDFLLSGSTGYCSHFAAAFTYLARLSQLPARIVSGYLGGELNPYDGTLVVREMDAHAWVEVFIAHKGWVKIDPTALVAPERLTMSTEEFNNKLNPYITIFNFKIERDLFKFAIFNNASLWLDSLNTRFSTNILNFDREKQLAFLRSLTPGNLSVGWIFTLSLSTFLILFWLLFYFYGKKKISPAEKKYMRFLKKMHSLGLSKDDGETISQFKNRCLTSFPEKSNYIEKEVQDYVDYYYKSPSRL